MTSFGHIVGEEAPLSVTVYPCLKHAQYITHICSYAKRIAHVT